MNSLLRYIGKKSNVNISEYIQCIEDVEIDTYCEPFGGGFSAGLNLIENGFKGKVILNDLDTKVYNFWKCVQNDWEKLYTRCIELYDKASAEKYNDDRLHILKGYIQSKDVYDRAAAEFIYRKILTVKGISFRSKLYIDEVDFYLIHMILKDVTITNLDYTEVLKKYDSENTFWFIDPPYDVVGVDAFYRCDSELFYHRELNEYVNKLKGKALITYNSSSYIEMLYENYYKQLIPRMGGSYFEIYFNNFKEF